MLESKHWFQEICITHAEEAFTQLWIPATLTTNKPQWILESHLEIGQGLTVADIT